MLKVFYEIIGVIKLGNGNYDLVLYLYVQFKFIVLILRRVFNLVEE